MCVAVGDDSSTTELYSDLLTVALKSARQNTSLDLVVLYDGPKEHRIYDILCRYNVKIIEHPFSHFDCLKKTFTPDILLSKTGKSSIDFKKLSGTFMRLDIPFIEKGEDYVLYTDVDVIFNRDIKDLDLLNPKLVAAGPEVSQDYYIGDIFNAGILYMNVKAMRKKCEEIFSLMEQGIPNKTNLFDQGYINEVCENEFDFLPLEYNWKPYWGLNENAYIIHFHGIKPGGTADTSGFAVNPSLYESMFRGHRYDFAGYLVYLKNYFSYLDKNADDWIFNHGKEVFKYISDSYKRKIFWKIRNKYYKYLLLNFLTFSTSHRFRIRKNELQRELKKFSSEN
ncbi:Lipopolysaccharide biosynthesis protein, LPS:glycosyltransferase [Succinivibrio dextrinosolvens DSM 3072]|uniref:Lipopolysaccharide biosynthesis protein, LPS:glycosyltransferase n=1 Tax=Succinivibrio dextrinosolvens DSM 3072 TaxID=1123324 RepID=A0A1T4VBM5_9GAMM|nr:glycosyltransferase [Succinivibrio dextrinosolvens]SKA62354.1 Lipopolysaccharide biosynthesis protein, LPS:glycosyltransferase [Succinivibrio dextrinosolvens DSM 3072]